MEQVSLSTVQGGFSLLLRYLTERHEHFGSLFTRHYQNRCQSTLNALVCEGVLFKGRWMERQWAGVRVLRILATGWLTSAITDGTQHWDDVLMRLLNVGRSS